MMIKDKGKTNNSSKADQEVLDELDKFIEKRKIHNNALKKIVDMKATVNDEVNKQKK